MTRAYYSPDSCILNLDTASIPQIWSNQSKMEICSWKQNFVGVNINNKQKLFELSRS